MKLRRIFLGCIALAFLLNWLYLEKGSERWSKRLSQVQRGWQNTGYQEYRLNELAWYGDHEEIRNRKIGFYDDMANGTSQWMENRDRVASYYFLRPLQLWFNDWQAFENEAELLYVSSDDVIPFTRMLKERKLQELFDLEESASGFSLYWRNGVIDEKNPRTRYKERNSLEYVTGGDPVTDDKMWLRLMGGMLGWFGIWLGGVWLLRRFYHNDDAVRLTPTVWEGWIGLAVGMLITFISLFLTGMVGISGLWVSLLLGICGWVLGWKGGIIRDLCGALRKDKMVIVWPLLWLLLVSGLYWVMASKPAGDLAALWSTAVKSRMILTQDGIGTWMYAGGTSAGGWADMQTHYPPGFPLLGSYLAWWGGGWHERACWLLPALLYASMASVFIQILAKTMAGHEPQIHPQLYSIFATMIAFAIFASQWFWWLFQYFYAESLLVFFGLCGFGVLFNKRESLSKHDYLLAGALLAGMGWVKNEGFVLMFLIALGYVIIISSRASWKKSTYLFLSAGVVILPWIICMLSYKLSEPFVNHSLLWERGLDHFVNKSGEVWKWFYKMSVMPPSFYSGAWLIGGLGLILGFCLRKNMRWQLLILWVISGWFFIQCCIFSASTLEEASWHLPAMPRLWMLPTLILIIIAFSNRSFSQSTTNQR